MSIAPQRFASLDQEFNLPLTTIGQSDPAKITNSASNSVSSFTSDILSAIDSIASNLSLSGAINRIAQLKNRTEDALGLTTLLGSLSRIEGAVRRVRGVSKSTLNTGAFDIKNIGTLLSRVFGNDPIVQNSTRLLNTQQNGRVAGDVTLGKPFVPIVLNPPMAGPPPGSNRPLAVGSNGNDYSTIVQTLNKASNNGFPYVAIDRNAQVQQVVKLANLGYDANMTGVMKSLLMIPNITPEAFARATSIVMVEQSTKGNVAAILDMTGLENGVLANDNAPINQVPSILSDTIYNFKLPDGTKEENLASVADSLFTSASALDTNWNTSDVDTLMSTKNIDGSSEDFNKIIQAKLLINSFDETQIMMSPLTADQAFLCAALANSQSVSASVKRMSNNCDCCLRLSSTYC